MEKKIMTTVTIRKDDLESFKRSAAMLGVNDYAFSLLDDKFIDVDVEIDSMSDLFYLGCSFSTTKFYSDLINSKTINNE